MEEEPWQGGVQGMEEEPKVGGKNWRGGGPP